MPFYEAAGRGTETRGGRSARPWRFTTVCYRDFPRQLTHKNTHADENDG